MPQHLTARAAWAAALSVVLATSALGFPLQSPLPQAPALSAPENVAFRCPRPTRTEGEAKALLSAINQVRRGKGLPALRLSAKLSKVAQSHACDNAARNSYSHTGSDGSDLRIRLKRGGYRLRAAAENTGIGFASVDRAMNFWLNSPKHRANILNPSVTELGVGLADGTRPAWVLVMARPM